MAKAIFAGRPEFSQDDSGRWLLVMQTEATPNPDFLERLSYVVVDLETTGNQHYAGDRIMEVAAVLVSGGKIVRVFETLVNPERPIPQFVQRLTRITWSMVKDAPRFAEIEPELMGILSGNIFVAHNSNFDWRFLSAEVRRASGREIIGRRLCTVRLSKKILPQLSRRSLDHVAAYYGVRIKNRHRAGGDAIATAECLIRLISDAADRGCLTWNDVSSLVARASGKRRKRRRSALPRSVDRDDVA
jgi:DNA polymerase-3 subunit epsilon